MASHKLAHIEIDDLEIIGYSVAGKETVVAIPQLDVCFDIGKAPDASINSVPGGVIIEHTFLPRDFAIRTCFSPA